MRSSGFQTVRFFFDLKLNVMQSVFYVVLYEYSKLVEDVVSELLRY